MALVEKETYKNAKTNGETEFHYVLKILDKFSRKMVTLLEDQHKVFDYTYEFNGLYRLRLMEQMLNIINPTVENSVEDFDNLLAFFGFKTTLQAKYCNPELSTNLFFYK